VEVGEGFLKALPATTQVFSSLGIPAPSKITAESYQALLAKDAASTQKGKYFAAAYFFLGKGEKERNLDGLLIDSKAVGAGAAEWNELFEPNLGHEVFVKEVCGKLTVVTPHNEVIEAVEKSCAGKIPSLAHAPDPLKKALIGKNLAQTFFLNFGQALSTMVDIGWEQETKESPAPEIKDAKKLLERIPAVALSGQILNNQISFKATSGAL
jgi:hypothetical protein